MELAGGDNILLSKQLTNNGNQESTKEKQAKIDQMKGNVLPAQCCPEDIQFPIEEAEGWRQHGQEWISCHDHICPGFLIHPEGGICGNQQSTFHNCGSRRFHKKRTYGTHFCSATTGGHPGRHRIKYNIESWYGQNYVQWYMLKLPQARSPYLQLLWYRSHWYILSSGHL